MSDLRLAVSGLGRAENPQPGAAIVAAIRRAWPEATVLGLVYDAYESGIYAEAGPDHCFLMPYPSAGLEAYLQRLEEIQARQPFDLFLPTLDTELALLAGHGHRLQALGIHTVLPEPGQLARVAKVTLPVHAPAWGVTVPRTAVVSSLDGALGQADGMGYPLLVKGTLYGAQLVHHAGELAAAVARLSATWGVPFILQEPVAGPELNLMGLADGRGRLLAHCAVRKLLLTPMGKSNGSVVIADQALADIARTFVAETGWIGPFELELIQDEGRQCYCLLEVNPRFPAWVDFPAQLGANYPAAWIRWILSATFESMPSLRPGLFFLRHQQEVVGSVDQLSALIHGLPRLGCSEVC